MPARVEYVLLPASRAFIVFTIALAFVFNLLPWGDLPGVPDLLALVLVCWNVRQPRRVGIGVGFALGLLIDVHSSALLGERALAYSILSYGAIALHRRLAWLGPLGQIAHLLPLFALAQLVTVLLRVMLGESWPGVEILLQPLMAAVLWPIVDWLLLLPQRRTVDHDDTRPL